MPIDGKKLLQPDTAYRSRANTDYVRSSLHASPFSDVFPPTPNKTSKQGVTSGSVILFNFIRSFEFSINSLYFSIYYHCKMLSILSCRHWNINLIIIITYFLIQLSQILLGRQCMLFTYTSFLLHLILYHVFALYLKSIV